MKLNIETNRGWIDTVFLFKFQTRKKPSTAAPPQHLTWSLFHYVFDWTTHLPNTMCPGPVEFGFYMFLRFLASLILRLCVLKCFHHQILELTYNVTRSRSCLWRQCITALQRSSVINPQFCTAGQGLVLSVGDACPHLFYGKAKGGSSIGCSLSVQRIKGYEGIQR